ncbi:MAG: 2-amino-4-hydroxy-6-hydroxymethyldihydropteridine diphosphokinase [Rhodospirillaceae bacterium]|nr:2-amino-4-hydroxy-6-hydroxymethyldihydropteridine diphosphokinase [Rhodospirillaceae bacterium]
MILIGIGANLPHQRFGGALDTCRHAVDLLAAHPDIKLAELSRWYESAPVPASDQPWFINGVASIETELSPEKLMEVLHKIEGECGRERNNPGLEKNAPRLMDLDLLDFKGVVSGNGDKNVKKSPVLPHPRMNERAFVLLPLADIAPDWTHPVTKKSLDELIKALNPDQVARPISTN